MIQNQGHSHNKIKTIHVKKASISPIPNGDKHSNDQVSTVNCMIKRFTWGHSHSKVLAEPFSDARDFHKEFAKDQMTQKIPSMT